MGSRNNGPKQIFRVGDMVDEGENSGLVVAAATSEFSGETAYIFVSGDGHLNLQYHHSLKGGVAVGDGRTVRDSAGRDLLAGLRSACRAETTIGDDQSAGEADDMLNYAEFLADFVRSNGRPGLTVVKAFAALDAQFSREAGPTRETVRAAFDAWRDVEPEEQQRILNGWRGPAETPCVGKVIADTLRTAKGETAGRALTFNFGRSQIYAAPEIVLTHGIIDTVTLTIREGTTREETIAALQSALAAVRSQWEKLIDLEDRKSMTLPSVAAAPIAAGESREGKARGVVQTSPIKKQRTSSPNSRKLGGPERRKTKAAA